MADEDVRLVIPQLYYATKNIKMTPKKDLANALFDHISIDFSAEEVYFKILVSKQYDI